jgi:serine/threonine protein kinase
MLWGLSYLHHEKMIHRDIKPGNVLLHSDGRVKLADFGISSTGRDLATTVVGTMMYMAPERLRGKKYGVLSDIWSFGLVVWECATGKQLFEGLDSMVSARVWVVITTICPPLTTISYNVRSTWWKQSTKSMMWVTIYLLS